MIAFENVSLRRGPRLLFEGVSFMIHPGQKVGLTGANGTGKSSLFALLRGELQHDSGEVATPRQWVIAHVAQETPGVERSAIDYVMDGDVEFRQIQRQLQAAEADDDGALLGTLHARLEAIDGYNSRPRAAKLMAGLGFTTAQEGAPVSSFSGGWRMRLNLAQALMCRSDLLLLDEPTNHLDLDAVIWLEEWLRGYAGTLILISHDRTFLDGIARHIAHIEHQKIDLYNGNYSAFERMRAEKLAQQQAAYEQQQREVAHIRSYVDRFRAKASKARQAQSRLKALERMEVISAAHIDSPFHFSFRQPEKAPHPLLTLEEVAVGYHDAPIITGLALTLVPGDRIGLLGPNGAGKSTLIKLLANELPPLQGRYDASSEIKIGYFAQHQLEQLRVDETPLNHMQRLDPKASEQALRNYLGGFGFQGERVDEAVAPFSGGEKARLVLALLVYQRPNLMLLDEPTNHLDLEMRHALTVALQAFEGAMVVVSHDRSLLEAVADKLLLVADGRVTEFDGDMGDYARWLTARRSEQHSTERSPFADIGENSAVAKRERRRLEAQMRKKLQPLKRQQQKLELCMEELNSEKAAIEQQLADSAIYESSARDRLKELLLRQGEIEQQLGEIEAQWLQVSEEIDLASVE